MKPNDQISPGEYWAELTKCPRPNKTIDFPRKRPGSDEPICQIAMVVLTQGEQMQAAANALRRTRKIVADESAKPGEWSPATQEIYQSCISNEVLYLSCKDPSDTELKKPFFRGVPDIEKYLSVDEIAVLMMHYIHIKSDLGPIVSEFQSDEEMDAWIETLARGGNFDPLLSVSQPLLIRLVAYLAGLLYSSQMDNSSAGSLRDSGESSSDSDQGDQESA